VHARREVRQDLARIGGGAAEVKSGEMAVLVPERLAPETAACLLEIDYLSDPAGERRLRDPAALDAMADAIARAVDRHGCVDRYGDAGLYRHEYQRPRVARAQSSDGTVEPQPSDQPSVLSGSYPVTAAQLDAVLSHSDVAGALGDHRWRAVSADGKYAKATSPDVDDLLLAVFGIYDYDRDVLVSPVWDFAAGSLVTLDARTGIQPPLTHDELAEARDLVYSDPRFANLDSSLSVAATPARIGKLRERPEFGHRCFSLTFWQSAEDPSPTAEAVVDLSARKLLGADAVVAAIDVES
jgi:hypothetical protein